MPIYALLFRLGKQVFRPGGMSLTRQMLDLLDVQATDDVVEFAPGMGATLSSGRAAPPLATRPSSATPPRYDWSLAT
jgi:hypothetical protein